VLEGFKVSLGVFQGSEEEQKNKKLHATLSKGGGIAIAVVVHIDCVDLYHYRLSCAQRVSAGCAPTAPRIGRRTPKWPQRRRQQQSASASVPIS
jgi:hypothetical protein